MFGSVDVEKRSSFGGYYVMNGFYGTTLHVNRFNVSIFYKKVACTQIITIFSTK